MLLNVLHSQVHKIYKNSESYNKGSNGFHIHSTLITMTKIIPDGNKTLSQVVDQDVKKARKVPHPPG